MNSKLAAGTLGAALLGAIGWAVSRAFPSLSPDGWWLATIGIVVGAIVTPIALAEPLRRFDSYVREAPAEDVLLGIGGLLAGLTISALLAFPLVMLGSPVGNILPIVAAAVITPLSVSIVLRRRRDLKAAIAPGVGSAIPLSPTANGHRGQVLLDTSAIIDGRIADISATGFITGEIIIPRFVLDELQHIADSPDVLRRNRGRRGLDMLNRMSKEHDPPINVMDIDARDVRDVHEVDGKLIQIARKLQAPIITNDWNLNKVAQLQGVRVLNVNELANAVKPVVLPNEEMAVKIIQIGKEPGQGVGYLDDGTMIVVEDGARYIDHEVDIVVTRVLQTVAGRMIFAALKGQGLRGIVNGGRAR